MSGSFFHLAPRSRSGEHIILITASLGWKRAIDYVASQLLEAERQEAERQYFTYVLVCWVARKLQPWEAALPRTTLADSRRVWRTSWLASWSEFEDSESDASGSGWDSEPSGTLLREGDEFREWTETRLLGREDHREDRKRSATEAGLSFTTGAPSSCTEL